MKDRPEAAPESNDDRRRRLTDIFGDDAPAQTRDDQPDPREDDDRSQDAWLKAQVPPHHG